MIFVIRRRFAGKKERAREVESRFRFQLATKREERRETREERVTMITFGERLRLKVTSRVRHAHGLRLAPLRGGEKEKCSSSSSRLLRKGWRSAAQGDDTSGRGRRDMLHELPDPCEVVECSDPDGTLLAAGAFERTLNGEKKQKDLKQEMKYKELKQDLKQAISEAFDSCGSEEKQEDCSAAWDKVDDLSYQLDKEEDKLE